MTAWSGPWGVSLARNLTPDKETGLGDWTAQNVIDTLRTGKRLGKGSMRLPPTPWQGVGQLTDDDLEAVFASLQSSPAVSNAVREPELPAAPPAAWSAFSFVAPGVGDKTPSAFSMEALRPRGNGRGQNPRQVSRTPWVDSPRLAHRSIRTGARRRVLPSRR